MNCMLIYTVERLLSDSSKKQCELDSAPVWLLKSLCMVFAPFLAFLINVSTIHSPGYFCHICSSSLSPSFESLRSIIISNFHYYFQYGRPTRYYSFIHSFW